MSEAPPEPPGAEIPTPVKKVPTTWREVMVYEAATGRATGKARVPSTAQPSEGTAFYDGNLDPETQYIDLATGEPADRAASGATIDHDTIALGQVATVSGLPMPCSVFVSGAGDVAVDDGVLSLSFESVGEYTVVLDEPAYLQETFTINVDAAP